MTDALTAREITITRVFDAPRDLVWRAWTEPDRLAQWWGKRGWSTQRASMTMDVRPGGVFRVVSVNDDDGREMVIEGVYREVVAPERLTFAEPPAAGCPETEGAVGSVSLTDLGDARTRMVFHTTMRATQELCDMAEGGMASAFDRLAEHLVQEIPTTEEPS